MDGSRSDRARARAQQLLAEIAPLPHDLELQRLRELSVNYIREAERVEEIRSAHGRIASKFLPPSMR